MFLSLKSNTPTFETNHSPTPIKKSKIDFKKIVIIVTKGTLGKQGHIHPRSLKKTGLI